MMTRSAVPIVLLGAALALAQAPEPIEVLPREVPSDASGDPLPPGARARMGTLRWRHGGPVHFVGFLGEGQEVLSASLDGWIRVWETATGRQLRRWQWHNGGELAEDDDLPGAVTLRSIVLSPDRRFLAGSLPDGRVRVWTVKGTVEATFGMANQQQGSNGLAFSPDGKTLASRGSDHIIRLWDFRTGKEIGRLPPPGAVEGQIIYYGRMGNTLAFSPDGKTLAAFNTWNTADAKGLVFLHEVESGKQLRRIEGLERSLSGRLAFGPGVLAVCWGDRHTKLYDADTGKELHALGEPKEGDIIHAAVFSPDGKTVAIRSGTEAPSVRVYDVASGKRRTNFGEQSVTEQDNVFLRMSGPGCSSMTIDFAANSKSIAEATGGRVVRIHQIK